MLFRLATGLHYNVQLVHRDHLIHHGRQRRAIADGDERWIRIDRALPPEDRVREFYHELGHVFLWEYDVHARPTIDAGEPFARLIAIALSGLDLADLARCVAYLRTP
jgi:hypothetical protein